MSPDKVLTMSPAVHRPLPHSALLVNDVCDNQRNGDGCCAAALQRELPDLNPREAPKFCNELRTPNARILKQPAAGCSRHLLDGAVSRGLPERERRVSQGLPEHVDDVNDEDRRCTSCLPGNEVGGADSRGPIDRTGRPGRLGDPRSRQQERSRTDDAPATHGRYASDPPLAHGITPRAPPIPGPPNTGVKLRSSEVHRASSASTPCWTAPCSDDTSLTRMTTHPLSRSPSRWCRLEKAPRRAAGRPPRITGFASTTLVTVRTKAAPQPQRAPFSRRIQSPNKRLPTVFDQTAS